MKYPRWFPCPTAWTKAIGSAILLSITLAIADLSLSPFDSFSFKPSVIIRDCIALLSPVPIVAIAHHYFYRFLDQLHSSARSPHATKFPKLSSLWEGLWAWSAIVLATIITLLLAALTPGVTEEMLARAEPHGLIVAFWFVLIAYLYQLEEIMQNP